MNVFFRDSIDDKNNELFEWTDDVKTLQNIMDKEETKGSGDDSEDWVGAYEKVLDDIRWNNGTK